jgi:Skp family chaperone for outer membrane proteins
VVNIGVVFNKYERAAAFKQELEDKLKSLKEEAKTLTENVTVWQAALQRGILSQAKKESYDEKIFNARRRLEDLGRTATQKVGKSQEGNLVILWKDVRAAVKEYSKQHGIELVIAYGDPLSKEMADLFPNINRKMQAMDVGGSLPFFIAPGVDISEGVVALLNEQFQERDNDGK